MRRSVFMLAALGAGFPAIASAQVNCGDEITAPTKLTGDILDCGAFPAVKVVGPAVLRMNGFTISCQTTDDPEVEPPMIDAGVGLAGTNAKLFGPGTVENCHNGIVLDEGGNHTVRRVTVTANGDGIEIRSHNNHVGSNTVTANLDEGLDIEGGNNTIIKNWVTENVDKGIVVNAGDENVHNKILNNIVTHNGDDGVELEHTADNTLILGNVVKNNAERGIELESDANVVMLNQIRNNIDEGIRTRVLLPEDADEDEVPFNSENNRIIGNLVRGHITDILDENVDPPCDGNEYIANFFRIADPSSCIQ